jgi:hypothetical protein
VQVTDETGHPLSGARVHSEAHAWVGPSGAFYLEGGRVLTMRGTPGVTGADGTVCLEDARQLLQRERARVNAREFGPSSVPYAGGFGPTQISRQRSAQLCAEYTGGPTGSVELPSLEAVLGNGAGVRILRMSPTAGVDAGPPTAGADAGLPLASPE